MERQDLEQLTSGQLAIAGFHLGASKEKTGDYAIFNSFGAELFHGSLDFMSSLSMRISELSNADPERLRDLRQKNAKPSEDVKSYLAGLAMARKLNGGKD